MRKLLVGWTLSAFLLGGCALTGFHEEAVNNYTNFYRAELGATPDAIAAMRLRPATGSPQVVPVAKWDTSDASVYARQGYVLIGSSGFTSGRPESDQDAIAQGISVGADLVVILAPEYQGTVTAKIPVTTPTATTSYTNGTATAYGPGGPVMAYGNSTTTTYSTNTTYVPMTAQRSAYGAGYFVKKRYRFGALCRDLTDSERQEIQTNRGAYIVNVVDGTPAYESDFLPGDVILSLDGQSANGFTGLLELVNANRGRTVEIAILRGGKRLSKRVSILE
jgi:membrane-associated protease RseP (regulator of RpoE activity)